MTEQIKALANGTTKRHVKRKWKANYPLSPLASWILILMLLGSLIGVGFFAYWSGVWHEKYLTLESVVLPKK